MAYAAGVKWSLPQDQFEIVGELRNGSAGLVAAGQLKPEIVLLPYRLPDGDGIRLAEKMLSICPHAKVVMLSSEFTEAIVVQAVRAGVRGLVSKNEGLEHILAAALAVSVGGCYACPESRQLMWAYVTRNRFNTLSPRETDILRLAATGKQNKEIADALQLELETVRSYRKSLMRKLGAKNVVELVGAASRLGLIDRYPQG